MKRETAGSQTGMPKPTDSPESALTGDDLAQQGGAPLPDREALSTIITGTGVDNFAAPINEAIAVNVDSDHSYAIADADQVVILDQNAVDVDDGSAIDTNDVHVHPNGKDK
jgi:hypothetical protein